MKKKILVGLLGMAVVVALTGCTVGKDKYGENTGKTDAVIKEDTEETKKTVYKLSKEYYKSDYDESERVSCEYEYDSNGNLIKKIRFYDTYEYMYDTLGKLYKEKNGDNMTIYEYDEDGNLIKESYYTGNGKYLQSVTEYEPSGELKLKTTYGSYAEYLRDYITTTTYIYDSNHKILMSTTKNDSGQIERTEQYEYDSKGNLIKMTASGIANANLFSRDQYDYIITYEYEYDESDKLVKEIYNESIKKKFEKKKYREYVCEYKYDSNGNLSLKNTIENNSIDTTRYEYIAFEEN